MIVLIRQRHKQRTSVTYAGTKRQSKRNQTQKQIVMLYRTRMQIEEGFRDCKATHYGLGLSQHPTLNTKRRAIL